MYINIYIYYLPTHIYNYRYLSKNNLKELPNEMFKIPRLKFL